MLEKELKQKEKVKILTKEEAQCSVFSVYGIQGVSYCKMYDCSLIRKFDIHYDEKMSICEDTLFVISYLFRVYGTITCLSVAPYHYEQTENGIVNNRYKKTCPQMERLFSEYKAIKACTPYIVGTKAQHYQNMRAVKGAVNTLRAMTATGYGEKGQYQSLLYFIRKNYISFLKWDGAAKSSKISLSLSIVSPNLEYFIWKRGHS